MHMVSLAIGFDSRSAKVTRHALKVFRESIINCGAIEYFFAVFYDKDQMHMQCKKKLCLVLSRVCRPQVNYTIS